MAVPSYHGKIHTRVGYTTDPNTAVVKKVVWQGYEDENGLIVWSDPTPLNDDMSLTFYLSAKQFEEAEAARKEEERRKKELDQKVLEAIITRDDFLKPAGWNATFVPGAIYSPQYGHYPGPGSIYTEGGEEVTRQFQIECAQKLLQHLAAFGPQDWTTTSQLTSMCGYSVATQAQVRAVLAKLRASGAVKMKAGGKNSWRINAKAWDLHDPFRMIDDSKLFAPVDTLTGIDIDDDDPVNVPRGRRPLGLPPADAAWRKTPTGGPGDDHGDDSDMEESKPTSGRSFAEQRARMREQQKEQAAMQMMKDVMQGKIEKVKEEMEKKMGEMKKEVEAAQEELKKTKDAVKRNVSQLEIKVNNDKVIKIKDVVIPEKFQTVLELAKNRRPILLVGPAGCGKTFIGELVAKTLGMRFAAISCTVGMSETYLLGRAVPNLTTGKNIFQTTDWVDLYEGGGVFLLDEYDAADPNMMLCINSAIANGYCNLPNRVGKSRALQHKDFILIATANTFGRGATRTYAGRNQMDEASLDRFRIGLVECDYDPVVEEKLCPDEELRANIQEVRRRVIDAGVRRVVSTRFIKDAYVMKKAAKWGTPQILSTLVQGWTPDELDRVGYTPGELMILDSGAEDEEDVEDEDEEEEDSEVDQLSQVIKNSKRKS